ncbi:MAG: hypothetical protein ACM3JH_16470 [Acidithiobacillales bacterium]
MQEALIGLVVLVLGWFAVGSAANVRRGNAVLKWLQGGLKQIGDKATVRWLGTTSVDLVLARAKAPFEQASLVVFLEPRDLPWLWAVSRYRGRRDTLILRARLERPPLEELELLDRESWSGREVLSGMKDERWSVREPSAPGKLPAYYKFETSLGRAEALLAPAQAAGMAVRRLSVRRTEPNLTLHVDLPAASADAAGFFEALRALGEAASRR